MTDSDATSGGLLTPREREVLAMVAAGMANREIGEALFISESTAGVHVSHLMAKLRVGSRTEAAAWAYQAGLVQAAPAVLPSEGRPGDAGPGDAIEPRSGWFPATAEPTSASASPSLAASTSPSVEPSASATAEPSVAPSGEASPPSTPIPTSIPLPKGTWSATGTMSAIRHNQSATLLRDGRVLVAGGSSGGPYSTQASAELYDPDRGAWTTTGEMVKDREGHTATLLDDGSVLVVGGTSDRGAEGLEYQATVELFDPETGTWRPTSSMNTARTGHTATLLADGTVLVAGGYRAGDTGVGDVLPSAEIYDPRTATWTSAQPMAEVRFTHSATRLIDGTVLVAGGHRDVNGGSTRLATFYDPSSRTWSSAGRMITGRSAHTATLLPDGTVLVVGGSSDLGPEASAEAYQPTTRSWTRIASMAEKRSAGTATLLRDGTVLVAGGYARGSYGIEASTAPSAEIFDPSGGPWTSTASMPQGRRGHLAILLVDGNVLACGGYAIGEGLRTVTFLYDPDGGP